jgi:hypothetical protein
VSASESKGKGARQLRREIAAASREKPLNGVVLNMAAGCNKPASPIAEKTVERLRAPEDGPKQKVWRPDATPECLARAPARVVKRGHAWFSGIDRWTRAGEVMTRAETLVGMRAPKGSRGEVGEGALGKSGRHMRMLLGNTEENGNGLKAVASAWKQALAIASR